MINFLSGEFGCNIDITKKIGVRSFVNAISVLGNVEYLFKITFLIVPFVNLYEV